MTCKKETDLRPPRFGSCMLAACPASHRPPAPVSPAPRPARRPRVATMASQSISQPAAAAAVDLFTLCERLKVPTSASRVCCLCAALCTTLIFLSADTALPWSRPTAHPPRRLGPLRPCPPRERRRPHLPHGALTCHGCLCSSQRDDPLAPLFVCFPHTPLIPPRGFHRR